MATTSPKDPPPSGHADPGTNNAGRELFAIVHIDMVGYSRLIGSDDIGTVEHLRRLRRDLIDPQIHAHRGRLVQTAGDSFLVTFTSIIEAARFAVVLQRQVILLEEDHPRDSRIRFRVGIELGDVIADGTDLHGNGVNVAVRLQTACPPGGICVSGAVHEHVKGRLDVTFESLGSLSLKNILKPVDAFVVRLDTTEEATPIRVTAGPTAPHDEAASKQAFPDGGLPTVRHAAHYRNSIAVMRFASLGSNPDETYFADGVVEDVVTALSRFRNLFVIGPSTSFRYSTGTDAVRDVVRELGVRYVVDGSVRRSGTRVRTNARLMDATTGGQLWAERFDNDEADVFAMQDRITQQIATAIEPTVLATEIERATRKTTESLDAYDLFLRAMQYRGIRNRAAVSEQYRLLSAAIALDANYAPALAYAALCYAINLDEGLHIPSLADRSAGIGLADAALASGPDDPVALCLAGHAWAALTEDFSAFVGHLDRALELNPNYAEAWIRSSIFRVALDDLDAAIEHSERAISLSPRDRYVWLAYLAKGTALLFQGRFEEAAEAARGALREQQRPLWAYRILIPALMELGQRDPALAVTAAFLDRAPDFRIAAWRSRNSFTRDRRYDIVEKWLRVVGLPD